MSLISNPHDHYFKEVFGDPEIAKDYLRNYLPADVAGLLDFNTLRLEKDSFVDDRLRGSFSDLVYRLDTQSNESVFVYVLLEHKSHPYRYTGLQLLKYMVRLWEHFIQGEAENQQSQLPCVVPLVFYHGVDPWSSPVRFHELVDCPDSGLASLMPRFEYLLCDLSNFKDEELKGEVQLRAALLLMKHIFDPDLAERIPGMVSLFADICREERGLKALHTFLTYLTAGTDRVTEEEIQHALEDTKGETIMPTLAQKWMEQGLEQGLKQGRTTALHSMVLLQGGKKFGPAADETRAWIESINDPARLESLCERLLDVSSWEELRD